MNSYKREYGEIIDKILKLLSDKSDLIDKEDQGNQRILKKFKEDISGSKERVINNPPDKMISSEEGVFIFCKEEIEEHTGLLKLIYYHILNDSFNQAILLIKNECYSLR